MKARAALLMLTTLLLMSSLAAGATPAATDLAFAPPPPAMSPLTGSSCPKSLAAGPVHGLTPAPTALSFQCGPCSTTGCVGSVIGNLCYVGSTQGTCQNAYGDDCGGMPLSWQCECWNGPLP